MNDMESIAAVSKAPQQPGQATAWRYILVDQGLVAIFVNFAINWGIAWAIFRHLSLVPIHGELSLEGDTVATCWMLPLISCLIVTKLTRNEVRAGRIAPLARASVRSPRWRFWTQNLFLRAVGWGLIGRFLLAPLAWQLVAAVQQAPLPLQRFLLFKALFACALGLFFCPFHAWWALQDDVRPTSAK